MLGAEKPEENLQVGDHTAPEKPGGQGFPNPRQWKWMLVSLAVYFGLRLLFFALTIAHYVPPDEVTHFGLAQIFSKTFLLPNNTPETYQHGLVTNVPWLYYWSMGKLLWLNIFGLPDLLFLRLLNIPFAFGTLYFSLRLLCLITEDRLTQLVLFVVLTNTLMFSFLSASISYDNLTNLFSVMAIYYLLLFFKERSGRSLVFSFLCQLAGCLTKASFLPLVLILSLLLIFREFRVLRNFPSAVKTYCKASARSALFFVVTILIGLVLNIQLYGVNYLQYGELRPSMSDVLSTESAMENRIAARNMIFTSFKEGDLNYEQAMGMVAEIEHEGDRAGTVYLLRNYVERRYYGDELMGPLEYISPWVKRMSATIFGVMGHISMFNQGATIIPITVMLVLAGAGMLLRWRYEDVVGIPMLLALICGGYMLIIMYVLNYKIYLYFESFGVALQGRYLFPVTGPFYVLFTYYLMRLFSNERARLGLAVVAAFIFIASDFPFFLRHATREWFAIIPLFFYS
jgi:hypothetical protein